MVEELVARGISPELVVMIISALPVIELRGAMPVAINMFRIPWYEALVLCVIGNMVPVPILLLFLDSLAKIARKVKPGRIFIDWLFTRTRKRSGLIEKYEHIGLTMFVAVPLPITGAWTGSIAAFLLGLKFRNSFLAILGGVIIAGLILTVLSLLGWVGAVIAGIALIMLVALGWWKL